MRAIVLTCGTGGGHNSAAEAVTEAILRKGWQAEQVDYLKLSGPICDMAFGKSYIGVVKVAPMLFGAAYGLGEAISSYSRHSPVYALNALLSGQLESYLSAHMADAIVCTHLYPAEALTYLKEKGRLRLTTVAVATDYTCIPFWEETRCDWYIAPHADCLSEFTSRGMSGDNILPYGIPVRRAFLEKQDRERCREEFGYPPAGRVLVVMGGSMGYGEIPALVGALLYAVGPDDRVVVICGHDEKLLQKLLERYGRRENLSLVGYTEDIASYMAAADVLFTKPGGLSSTEAAVVGVPIVHTAPIPGCETRNMRFFENHGMSVSARDVVGVARQGLMLANSPEARAHMRDCQSANALPDAADRIAELLARICGEGDAV